MQQVMVWMTLCPQPITVDSLSRHCNFDEMLRSGEQWMQRESGGLGSFSPDPSTAVCTDPCSTAWTRDQNACILLICSCFSIYESYSAMESMTTSLTKTHTDTDRWDLKGFSSEPAISDRVFLLGNVCFIYWFGDALTYRSPWYERPEKHETFGGWDSKKFVGTRAEWFGLLPFKY